MPRWPFAILVIWLILISAVSKSQCPFSVKDGTIIVVGDQMTSSQRLCDCDFDRLIIRRSSHLYIPDCLDLKEFKLTKTHIPVFPRFFRDQTNLEKLTLRFAGLDSVPSALSRLESLRELDLRGNELTTLPQGLDQVRRIDLRFNPIDKREQEALRARYPQAQIFFSSPCNCN